MSLAGLHKFRGPSDKWPPRSPYSVWAEALAIVGSAISFGLVIGGILAG